MTNSSQNRELLITSEGSASPIRCLQVNAAQARYSLLSATQNIAVAALESDATVASIGFRFATAALIVFLLVITARAGELPNAPHLSMRAPTETYSPDERLRVHNYPNRRIVEADRNRIFDWSFILGHGIYAGSLAFDSYETARNVGTCASEGNPDLGTDPGNRRLVVHGLVEFGAVLAGDALIKWAGRRNNVPRWLNTSVGVMAAGIGTAKHLNGGMQWVRLCQ